MNIQAKGSLKGSIHTHVKLTGNIKTINKLTGKAGVKNSIKGHLSVGDVVKEELEYYEETYEIEPSADHQTLYTKEKTLIDNITIKPIPYAEVSNNANGYTVTIG